VTRKREPVAEIGAEDYRIVKHTHDIEVARRLMVKAMADEDGCPAWDDWPAQQHHTCSEECTTFALEYWAKRLNDPRQLYVRVQGALPNSYAAAEGWAYEYVEHDEPGRGRFKAVVFR